MGSSEKGTGVADCGIGTIVWVRRRNGSWWPGKILGPDELSAAHLMSPRSGTPVKLLGREDASVDWYNLEKSKRVKAFRCGEFDDCIERAESSQGMPPKKREKYARREDAILHALDLEKHLLEKKHGKLGSSNSKSSKSSDSAKKELVTPSEGSGYGNANGKHVQPKAHSKKAELSFEDKNMDHELNAQKIKEGNQLAGDEDNSEVIPRTRGLQDFGLKITPAKRKISSSVALNGSRKPECVNNAHALPGAGVGIENTAHASSRSSLDKKRKLNEVLTDESLVRRRDRRRPLVQVLQSSERLGVHSLLHDSDAVSAHTSGAKQAGVTHGAKRSSCVYLPGESSDCSDEKQIPNQMVMPHSDFEMSNCPEPAALAEEHTSESTENTETDSSETDSLDSDVDEDMVELPDDAVVAELEPKSPIISGTQMQHGSRSSEEPNDLALSGGTSRVCPPEPVLASMGASKWKLKGKRNNRGFTKRSNDVIDRRVSRDSMYGINLEEPESNGCDEPDLIGKNFRTRRHAFDNRGYLLSSKSTPKGFDDIAHGIIDWEDLAWNDQPILKGYWEDSSNYFDHVFVGRHGFGGRLNSMLIDVDLKVQSSYQREHVPMISLMSKLNGQAIVGHPVQIEALENGSSDILLSAADGICPETSDNDTALAPVWRTARRTANFRIPRSHPSATLDGEETAEHAQYMDQDKKTLFKKSNVGSFGHKPSTTRKSLSHASRAPLDRKFSRKPPKKVSLSSSQKIKTLSSIGSEHKLGNDSKHGNDSYQVDGLIKGESGPTAVACIPVKLVFSRLYEELVGRHQ